mmetsp:Transcript_11380/g.19443  ORF Transcript_11380/g.19443 Transcript_11380/m.19443 type:complete len:267 (-) Transcript_11380:203-1003(-)|eukprot:CAMPEP_0198228750 /NCGR_PEP_ID=MMETSP1445-20131203/113761_1 /TAXON_ID=36898 /ORGANISM="Pyramimonas sp., Strain CCMP2087" /LENGTH=266 /DNA_ID=CAMNT_0043909169 /DNA_START=62 /DNA_END=862 /DNA_ORIENTATION=-
MAALHLSSMFFPTQISSVAPSRKKVQSSCATQAAPLASRASAITGLRLPTAGKKRVAVSTNAAWNPFAKSTVAAASVDGTGYPAGKLTIFTSKGSRAQIIEWYAVEKGLEFESVSVNMRNGDHKKKPFTNVNPFGKMPAVQAADGTPVFESGAILLYLAGLAGELKSPEDYATAAKWILYANATYWSTVEKTRTGPPDQLDALNALLSDRPFLLGEEFSVSDVALGSYLYYTKAFFGEKFGKHPNVSKYLTRLMEMKSFKATCGAS